MAPADAAASWSHYHAPLDEPAPSASLTGFRSPASKERKARVGLQLPAHYVPRGTANAFWNKSFAIRASLDRRVKEKRVSKTPDPWLLRQQQQQQQQQQQFLLQREAMMLAQHPRFSRSGHYPDDYEEESSEDERFNCRKKVKEGMLHKSKAIFAFLMIPSLVMMLSTHKSMNKESSNVDINALRAGGYMGGGGGIGGGMGAGFPSGIKGMEGEPEVPGMMPHHRSHAAMQEGESPSDYVRRLMAPSARNPFMPDMTGAGEGIDGYEGGGGRDDEGDKEPLPEEREMASADATGAEEDIYGEGPESEKAAATEEDRTTGLDETLTDPMVSGSASDAVSDGSVEAAAQEHESTAEAADTVT